MASARDNAEFARYILPPDLLDMSIDWIGDHLNPDDVFGRGNLVLYCRDNCRPEEVFSQTELEDWAEEHGFTKDL